MALTDIRIPEGVWHLGSSFHGCTSLTNVILLATLTDLAGFEFVNCSALREFTIPAGAHVGSCAFSGCAGLETVRFPQWFRPRDYNSPFFYAFNNCPGLWTVVIGGFPASEYQSRGMPRDPIAYRQGLEVRIEGTVSAVPACALYQFLLVQNSTASERPFQVTSVDGYLETLILEEGVRTIGSYAVAQNPRLRRVVLPSSLRTISNGAFSGASALTEIELPDGLESIGDSAFAGVPLARVSMPNSVTNIGRRALGSLDVCQLELRPDNPNLCVADGVLYRIVDGVKVELVQVSPTRAGSMVVPATVASIVPGAFSGCTNLTEVVLPDGIREIPGSAFSNCTRLKRVHVPASVNRIASSAFRSVDFKVSVGLR